MKEELISTDKSDVDDTDYLESPFNSQRKICLVCSCTYIVSCLKCEQIKSFQLSIKEDTKKCSESESKNETNVELTDPVGIIHIQTSYHVTLE